MSDSGSMVVTEAPRVRRQCDARTVCAVVRRYERTSPFDEANFSGPRAVRKTSDVRSSASARLPTRAYIKR